MNFKVGQRVKIVHFFTPPTPFPVELLGSEGVVTSTAGAAPYQYCLKVPVREDVIQFAASELAPLVDDKAEQFLERIKNLKPHEEPTVPMPQFDATRIA